MSMWKNTIFDIPSFALSEIKKINNVDACAWKLLVEDNQNDQSVDKKKLTESVGQSSFLQEKQATELQKFFSDVIPPPIAIDTEKDMETDELFSQLLSSITQGIEDFNKSEDQEFDNTSNKALRASSLIGRSVLVQDGRFYLEEGASALGRLLIDEKAHHVLIYVENEALEIVRIIPLGDDICGEVTFTWNGVTRTGERAPEGDYRFIVSSICNSRVKEQQAYTYNKIIRVSYEGFSSDMVLHFENDFSMKLNEVVEILK